MGNARVFTKIVYLIHLFMYMKKGIA
jgi:hypothetical protein